MAYLKDEIRSRAACFPEANPTGCSAMVVDLIKKDNDRYKAVHFLQLS